MLTDEQINERILTPEQIEFQDKVNEIKRWVQELDKYKLYRSAKGHELPSITDKQYAEGIQNFMNQLDQIAETYGIQERKPSVNDKFDEIIATLENVTEMLTDLQSEYEMKPIPMFREAEEAYDNMMDSFDAMVHREVNKVMEDLNGIKR